MCVMSVRRRESPNPRPLPLTDSLSGSLHVAREHTLPPRAREPSFFLPSFFLAASLSPALARSRPISLFPPSLLCCRPPPPNPPLFLPPYLFGAIFIPASLCSSVPASFLRARTHTHTAGAQAAAGGAVRDRLGLLPGVCVCVCVCV